MAASGAVPPCRPSQRRSLHLTDGGHSGWTVIMPLLRPLYRHRAIAGMGKAADMPGVARIRGLPLCMFNRFRCDAGSMRGNISPNRPEIRGMSVKATSYCRHYRRRDNRHTCASHLVSVRHRYRLSYAIRRTRISARPAAQRERETVRSSHRPYRLPPISVLRF